MSKHERSEIVKCKVNNLFLIRFVFNNNYHKFHEYHCTCHIVIIYAYCKLLYELYTYL